MKKCVELDDKDVTQYLFRTFPDAHPRMRSMSCDYDLYTPPINVEFEIIEAIEYPAYDKQETPAILKPGIYRFSEYIGLIWWCHQVMVLEKYESGSWINIAPRGYRGIIVGDEIHNTMIDWRGIKPVSIQHKLPL